MKNFFKKHLWQKILVFVLVLAVAVSMFAGNYLVNYAIVRSDSPNDVSPASAVSEDGQELMAENLKMIASVKEAWLNSVTQETVHITSDDGLVLEGDIFLNSETTHKWLIAVHGYTSNRTNMQNIASFYGENGYNVLTPDMRSHGGSEGTYIGMGWLDRLDVLKWIDYIIELDPEAEIILHGVSMGAATVMMVSGEDLPSNVLGIIEDCGYTSVWDIFSDELSYLFSLPDFPFLYTADLIANIRAGYGFKTASALNAVSKSTVPILFIHGSIDTFVRTDMVYELYDACSSPKDLLIIEGAGHGDSYRMDPDTYFDTVFSFISENCGI